MTAVRRALWVLRVLLSHWRRNPLQLAALLAGLAIATALWSGVQALNAEARASYDRAAALVGQDRFDRLEPALGVRLDQETWAALRRAGWDVSPLLEEDVEIGERRYRLIGADPLTLPAGRLGGALAASEVGIAEFTGEPGALLAGPETLDRLGADEGARPATRSGARLPPLVAVEALPPDTLVADIGAVQRALGREGQVTTLLIDPEAPEPPTPWQEAAPEALELVPAGSESDIERLTDSFHLNLTAFGFLSFVVGLFIVHAAVGLAFEQRLGTIRTLRACGVSAAQVAGVMLAELVAFALLAGLAGVAGGYALAALLLPDVAGSLRGLYGASVSGELSLRPEWWLAGLGMSLLGVLAAAGHTLARAFSMPVLASARRQAWRAAQARQLRWQVALGLAALALAGLAWGFGDGLAAGFVVLAGLLVGAALMMPAALAAILSVGGARVRGPLGQWAFADSRQQLSGLSLALMALLLALAANIGVGTMVESFRTTFTDWLDQRLAPELYYDAQDAAQEARIQAFLADREDVRAILPTARVDSEVAGWPTTVYGRTDHATYREEWPLIDTRPGGWDRVSEGKGAMVSEQLARRAGLDVGDPVVLSAPSGPWTVSVEGIYPDYGNPKGQVSVSLAELRARWPDPEPAGTGVRVEQGRTGAVLEAMREEFALGARDVIDQESLKALSNRIFERTFAVTGMLNVLTLAVAGVALFASLATLADLRLAQLAPLWAMGVTRRRLAALELGKTLGMALATGVMAVPLGIGVAWVLVAIVNVEAFGWRLPLHLFPGQWAWLMGLTALTALLAAALPMLRLARMAPARLVKIFAEER